MSRVFHLSTISTKKEEKNQKKKETTAANSNVNLSFNCVDKREQFRPPTVLTLQYYLRNTPAHAGKT